MQNIDTQDESKYLDPVMLQYGMKVYTYDFPEAGETIKLKDIAGKEYEKCVRLAKTTLEHVRDVFCFCCSST